MATNALSPDYFYSGLMQRGLPEHVARGFVANGQSESGLNPGINELAPTVPGSRGGFGLMQWTGPRRRALEAFASNRGVSASDPNAQMDFLMSELQGPESRAWGRIQATDTPEKAAAAIVNDFLRPAEVHRASREADYLGGVTFNPENAGRAYTPAAEGMDAQDNATNAFDPSAYLAMVQQAQQANQMKAFEQSLPQSAPLRRRQATNALAAPIPLV